MTIGLVILSMGGERLDTRNPTSKLMLTILAGVATWEREIMLERQREGLAKAKAAGKYKGRPVSIDAAQIEQLRAELGPAAIAKKLGIARSSVYRALRHRPQNSRCGIQSVAISARRHWLQSADYAATHISRPIADRDVPPPLASAKTIPHRAHGWLPRPSLHRGSVLPPNKN